MSFLRCLFETASLICLEPHQGGQGWIATEDPGISASCLTGVTSIHSPPLGSLCGLWGLNIGPHACKASPSLTEPSLQPSKVGLVGRTLGPLFGVSREVVFNLPDAVTL